MKDMKALIIKLPSGGPASLCRLAVVACLAVALAVGCHKNNTPGAVSSDEVIVPSDPQVVTNLGKLTMDLHEAFHHHSQGFSNFDEFVSYAQVQPPPPPSGMEYAIKEARIVLVKARK